MKKLYYPNVWPPVDAVVVSEKMNMKRRYNPWLLKDDEELDLEVTVADFFKIAKTGDYDTVKILVDDNGVYPYFYDDENRKVSVKGWIDLLEWEDGGDCDE